jgi:hypothetical protein
VAVAEQAFYLVQGLPLKTSVLIARVEQFATSHPEAIGEPNAFALGLLKLGELVVFSEAAIHRLGVKTSQCHM